MAKGARRDRDKATAWRRAMRAQAGSGMSVRSWCCKHRVKEASFYWWRRTLARRDAQAPQPAFIPVRVSEQGSDGERHSIEIVLADGRRVCVSGSVDRQALADVLDVLERRAC